MSLNDRVLPPLSAEHRLLLQACLGDEAAARAAWKAWEKLGILESIDSGSFRLLPLLYRRLHAMGMEDDGIDRYRGIYRKAWFENQRIIHRAARVVGSLHAAGIPTLALKGVALASLYYPEVALRPMDDADLLVPFDSAGKAVDLLLAQGWRAKPVRSADKLKRHDFAKRQGWNFVDAEECGLDLHWRLLAISATGERDGEFWARARPFSLIGVECRTLCAADHLIHVCVHGASWNWIPAIRWIVDAKMIIGSDKEAVDWEGLVGRSRDLRVALVMSRALDVLVRDWNMPIPPWAGKALAEGPFKRWERREFDMLTRLEPKSRRRYYLWHRFLRYRETSAAWARAPVLWAYLKYLRERWELDRPRQIPGFAIGRIFRPLLRRRQHLREYLITLRFWLSFRRRRDRRQRLERCRTPEDYYAMAKDEFGIVFQIPAELLGFVNRIIQARPRCVCEIGTLDGGTNFFLTHAPRSVEFMLGVDLFVRNKARLRCYAEPGQELRYIDGSSHAAGTVERARRALDGRQLDVLFIDGDHSYAGVSQNFKLYRQFVRDGGLIAFHDICPDYLTRYGRDTKSCSGEVPVFWNKIKMHFPHEEFVEDPGQDSLGIGVIRYSPAVQIPDL